MIIAGFLLAAALAQDGQIDVVPEAVEEETLPSVEELAFPTLTGDFDGDGSDDTATARQGDDGVRIALELSASGETFTESLGADTLRSVEWRVVGPEETQTLCSDPLECPSGSNGDARDSILVILDGQDSFILRWDGGALETFFVDA